LVGDVFEPGLVCFDVGDHFCEPMKDISIAYEFGYPRVNLLLTDDWLLDEFLSEDYSLVAPLQAFFCYETAHADYSTAHHPTLVVEVCKNDIYALVLLAEEIFNGNLDAVSN